MTKQSASVIFPMKQAGFFILIVLLFLLSGCVTPPNSPPQEDQSSQTEIGPDRRQEQLALELIATATTDQGSGDQSSALIGDAEAVPLEADVIYQGTGEFINRQAASGSRPVTEVDGEVTLNFESADIRDVIKIVFDTLEENYVIDPQVQGEVTVQTSSPLPREALLPTLESLLRNNGAALIQDDGLYRVLPANRAVSGNLAPRLPSANLGPGYSVRIFPLDYISATEMETILQPFAPEAGILLVDPVRNLLVLAGTEQELTLLEDTINIFDVNWLQGMSVGFYTLENVEAQTLVTELEGIFGQTGGNPMSGMFRFVPVTRLNSVIVITPQPEFLTQASQWITRLDGSVGERLYIYEVQNGDAEYIASILGEVFGGTSSAVSAPSNSGQVAPGQTPGQIGGGIGGSSSGLQAQFMGSPAESILQATAEQPLNQADGGGQQPVRLGQSNSSFGGAITSSGAASDAENVRIIADVENNALLIWANAPNYNKIVRALRRLDITPRQVLIEVTIAEVTLSGALRYGLQWFFSNGVGDYTGTGSLNLNTDIPVGGSEGILANANRTFSYVLGKDGIVRALLETLAGESQVRILSSPQIMVIDNQDAEIRVGDQQPVRTSTTLSDGGNLTESISFKDTGVFLSVTPQVNSSGLVTMNVAQEVIDVGGIDNATGQRVFFERSLSSKVAVQSNETIALGGLISEERRGEEAGVPFLYKVPVIGPLFGRTDEEASRTELLILITPRVVQNSREAELVSLELRRRMRAVDPFLEVRGSSPLLPTPVLDE